MVIEPEPAQTEVQQTIPQPDAIVTQEPVVIEIPEENETEKEIEEIPEVIVEIKFLRFDPNITEIEKGTKVTWVHIDDIKPFHIITSKNSVERNGLRQKMFISNKIAFEESFSFIFNESGTYEYYDPLFTYDDREMMGTIIVK
jgi:plastocyanin